MRIRRRKPFITRLFKRMTPESWFAAGAASVLILSIVYWSWFSALVNAHNSDQLVDQFLFENSATLHGAVVPGAHSFLLKWPLFFVVQYLGGGTLVAVATVFLCLVTVVALMAILYKINRRPYIFGILCLGLALALLLTPTEPYPGALLPANMAMLSTRNIEYILYIAAIISVIKARHWLDWKNALAVLLLMFLIASDKLFLASTIGGAGLMLATGLLRRRTDELTVALRWLVIGICAVALTIVCLKIVNHMGLMMVQDSTQVAPYTLLHDVKSLAIGFIYGIMGLLTEVGANPSFDAMMIKTIPGAFARRVFSPIGISFLMTIVTFGTFIVATYRLFARQNKHKKGIHDTPFLLSLAMLWTTLTVFIVFVVSNHYQPVDARYLAIILFTVFIVLATYLREFKMPKNPRVYWGTVTLFVIAITMGINAFWQQNDRSNTIYSEISRRNALISAALTQHPVQTLVGDYWRVFPIKSIYQAQTVFPLSDCTTPRAILTSKAWAPDETKSFAYLLSALPTSASYKSCSIDQIVTNYGRPSSMQLITGTLAHPEEMLLFYDYGMSKSKQPTKLPAQQQSPASAILPKSLANVIGTDCLSGKNIMNIVAHQDDDLLFINPATYHSLQAGDCVRSVYITAGDSGLTSLYWLGREEGTEAAYATMLHSNNPIWISRTVTLSSGNYVTMARLKDSSRVSLVFMHLPDGNTTGRGFRSTHYESLARLQHGMISTIHTVDSQSSYTSNQLISALANLMNTYQPVQINTQARTNHSKTYPDHSDHLMAGWYAEQAYLAYSKRQPNTAISYFIGYPKRDRLVNVTGTDAEMVNAAFFAYARHDSGTCASITACSKMSYGYYLNREYKEDN